MTCFRRASESHRRPGRARVAVLAGLLVGGVVLSGCGSVDDGESLADEIDPATVDGPVAELVDLEGVELWVGSDDTTAQTVLGAVAAELLASTGAEVETELGFGNPVLTRDGLRSGEFDLAYTPMGQAWTGYLREPELPDDVDELFRQLADRDLEENRIAWAGPLPFSTGRGLAVGADGPALGRISEIPDYLDTNDDVVFCVTSDFVTFPEDGRVDVEETLDVTLPDSELRVYDAEPIYPDTGAGSCALGLVTRGSGRIAEYDLRVLEDDVDVFMLDNPAVSIRAELLEDHPELAVVFDVIADRLSEHELRELNRRVEIGGEEPAAVAREWLEEEDLVP